MSAHSGRGRGRRGGGGHDGHAGPDERWLLTYADMITLLMALFIVMWAMSTVNISRFAALKASLAEAFNGNLTNGGASVQNGAEGILPAQTSLVAPHKPQPIAAQTFDPVNPIDDPMKEAEKRDLENLRRLKQEIDQYAISHSLDGKIKTFIDERGLVIRVLTDDLLFDSGRAVLKGAASGVLGEVADLVVSESRVPNPVRVEGNTDDRPISTAQFHSNWELSTARAAAVIQFLLGKGLNAERASIAGYADQRPIASNATPSGRSLNRRVEIVVLRRSLAAAEGAALAGAAEGSHTTTEDAHADKEPKTTVKKPDQGAAAKPAAAAEKPAAPSGDGH